MVYSDDRGSNRGDIREGEDKRKERMRKEVREVNPFHLVDESPWPVVVAMGVLGVTTGGVEYMHGYGGKGTMIIGIIVMGMGVYVWMRDIVREGTYEGQHTSIVQRGLRTGMMLFIISEVFFFVAFFWGYFWAALAPTVEIGSVWPPKGIEVMNAWGIPLLNTMILLTSGASITWAHHGIVVGSRTNTIWGLIITIGLGVWFTGLQAYEYVEAGFEISDGIYGSTFFLTTGFHGMHVIVGTIMIIVTTIRVWRYEMTREHHFGLEASAWYWHFVDVVWLGLFVSIYWWGG